MKTYLKYLLALSGLVAAVAVDAARSTSVGTQTLRVAEARESSQIISVPFLKPAVARGRLDGVDADGGTLTDAEGAFSALKSSEPYVLQIVSGPRRGNWFVLDVSPGVSTMAGVADDGLAGSLSDLDADEAFSVHPLFSLRELLPENGAFLPSASIDVKASQVHFFNGKGFEKFWISDGTITSHRGWTRAEAGELKYAGDTVILPGTSFVVQVPEATGDVEVRVNGVVPRASLTVPVFDGFNFVAAAHSGAMEGSSFLLGELGLHASGFGSPESGDVVYSFDPTSGKFGKQYIYDDRLGEFICPSRGTVADLSVQPGSGFILYNAGDAFLWKPQK